ncbi:TolC family protein [Rhodoferax bucti]|uniref:TolC family protein n=1 Tax=Rhodoferax bucti TaxID=2576305 RepID=UPI00110822F8|nr:TolC family protein [Rhodoferax bucti]
MHRVPNQRRKPLRLATLALCALAGVASAQPTTQEPVEQGSTDWRKANEAVSQFKRGHADVLKWEQANDTASKDAPAVAPDFWLKTADAAVRQAWRARPELGSSLSQLGAANQEHIAQGRWLEVDPAVRRHVDEFDAILDTAVDARKAWWGAVAAQASLKSQRDMQEASGAAAELARRMARVGNWSRMEQAQSQSRLGGVKLQTLKAEAEAKQAHIALLKALRLQGTASSVGLPDGLPDVSAPMITADAIQKGLKALRPVLPRAEGMRVQATAKQAFDIYEASYAAARLSQEEQTLRQFVYDETVLRYNGMLLSVWDLLAETGAQLQANVSAINAKRDLLIAEADLQLVLQGGAPASFVGVGSGATAEK